MAGKTCPHCGASLPGEASFCPYCVQRINRRTCLHPPGSPIRGRVARALVLLVVLAAAILAAYFALRPQVYEGQGEVLYRDPDGAYQLVFAYSDTHFEPLYVVNQNAEVDKQYRFPVRLYINYVENDAKAGQAFLRKVDSVQAYFIPPEKGGSVMCTAPAPSPDYAPDAALVSYVDFVAQRDFTAQMVWELKMNNGDLIRLWQDLNVTTIKTLDFFPEDYPMETAEELQTAIDEISATVDPEAVVNLHLPPVTYQGDVTVKSRVFNFYGNTNEAGDRRTTFTGSLRLDYESDLQFIAYIEDIDFRGSGDGIGIAAASRARAVDCTFTGWKTGFFGYGKNWVNVIGCIFEENEVGFHFNSTGESASHTMYNNNIFRNNGTAVLLENVPTDLELNFQDCRFSGNGVDIDNRCDQPLNIAQAIFE